MILRNIFVWIASVVSFYGIMELLFEIKGVRTGEQYLDDVVIISSIIFWFSVIVMSGRSYEIKDKKES